MPLQRGKMKLEDERRINKNIVKLKREVDPLCLVDYFIQEELFDISDLDSITSYIPNTKDNRWQCFLRLLFDCGPTAYDTLLLSLEGNNYSELAKQIRTTQLSVQERFVDAEDKDSSSDHLQSELLQKKIKLQQPVQGLERVSSQKYNRTLQESFSNEMDIKSSQLKTASNNMFTVVGDGSHTTLSQSSQIGNISYRTRSHSSQILPLKQALAKVVDENIAVRVMPLKVTELSREPKFMMKVIVADESQACKVILYNEKYEERMSSPSHSIQIVKAKNKQSHLVVTSITEISIGPKFTIPPAVHDTIIEKHQTVKEAISSPEGKFVSVKGKISKINVSPCKKALYNRMEWFTEVTIEDSTAPVSLALWGNVVENIKKGQILALENVKVKLFNNEKRLTNTRVSIVKIISNDQLCQLSEDDDEEENLKTGIIIGLLECEPYSSCPLRQCRNKKLNTAEKEGMLMCPKHGELVSSKAANIDMYARFHVETSNNILTLVAFTPVVKLLLEANDCKFNPTFDKQNLERKITSMLPYTLRFHERNGVIESICPKRRIPS